VCHLMMRRSLAASGERYRSTMHDVATNGSVRKHNETFTGRRLDMLKCVNADPRLRPYDFKVAFTISSHVNEKTGVAILSDELIAHETGGSPRSVRDARTRLRKAGWIGWQRTYNGPNTYWLCFDQVYKIRAGSRKRGHHNI
jgi:hypothetical protein